MKVLILHGMLHLAGYDHETDNGRMEEKEARLRAQLKLPASLIQRTQSLAGKPAGTKTKFSRRSGVKKQTGLHTSNKRPKSTADAKKKKRTRA
jgi:probable rRNA maturation factor